MTNSVLPGDVATVSFPGGGGMPALGLGTWRMGESARARAREVAAVREALALGYRLIDTAEMYGEGEAESIVGEAVADALRAGELRREDLCIVSKIYPHNASRKGTPAACDRSRRRLGLDRIDVYLLHWRGQHPLVETVEALAALVDAGSIGRWGVSNFDAGDLDDLQQAQEAAGCAGDARRSCVLDQVYYSLATRGPEFSVQPWLRRRGMALMAYSPIDQGALCAEPALIAPARARGCTTAQMALAWLMQRDGVVAIPKAVRPEHLRENFAAAQLRLTPAELAQLDRDFPPPRREAPLAML